MPKMVFLDKLKGVERSCVFRIGIYLQELINNIPELADFSLDCEYNKSSRDVKRLEDKLILPDMILHKRFLGNSTFSFCDNLLAIEFKGYWNRRKNDIEKLKNLTDYIYGYNYKLGAAVTLTPSRETAKITYIANGQIITQ